MPLSSCVDELCVSSGEYDVFNIFRDLILFNLNARIFQFTAVPVFLFLSTFRRRIYVDDSFVFEHWLYGDIHRLFGWTCCCTAAIHYLP